MSTITAPAASQMRGEIVTHYGPVEVRFIDGVAEYDGDLPAGVHDYLIGAGYTVDGTSVEQADPSTPLDSREVGLEQIGTTLRDSAVDPQPVDFLPPVNAGEADPHGPLVVAPGIHAEGERVVRSGPVRTDPDQQSKDESAFAEKLLVENEPITAPSGADWKEGTGPLGLSDPGSVGEAGDASTESADADNDPAAEEPAAEVKRARKRAAGKAG